MLYVFGSIPVNKEATDYLMDFIEGEPSGIFTLPEAFLRINIIDAEKLKELTSDGKKVIVVGSDVDKYEKARLFVYGESEPIFDSDYGQMFTIPYENSEIRTIVRACNSIFKPYGCKDFELICHPSAMSLETLKNKYEIFSASSEKNILSCLGLKNTVIASSNNYFDGTIIDASGQDVGTEQLLKHGIKCKTYEADFIKN